MSLLRSASRARALWDLDGPFYDLVDEPVVPRLVVGEPAVPVRVGLDAGLVLAGVERDAIVEHALGVEHLLGLDRDVRRRADDAAGRLMHHDPGVREGVTLALGARTQQ